MSSRSRRIERSQTIDENNASKSPTRESAQASAKKAQHRKKFSAAAIFSGLSDSAAASFVARHSGTTKKSSFSGIRFPSFSPQQNAKNEGTTTNKIRCHSPQPPASARSAQQTRNSTEIRPKRFSFAINRKRWFSTSTPDPKARNSVGGTATSRRTSTTEISSTLISEYGLSLK